MLFKDLTIWKISFTDDGRQLGMGLKTHTCMLNQCIAIMQFPSCTGCKNYKYALKNEHYLVRGKNKWKTWFLSSVMFLVFLFFLKMTYPVPVAYLCCPSINIDRHLDKAKLNDLQCLTLWFTHNNKKKTKK